MRFTIIEIILLAALGFLIALGIASFMTETRNHRIDLAEAGSTVNFCRVNAKECN